MPDTIGTIRRLSQPETEPISTGEAKSHLRLPSTFTNDDANIDRLVKSARDHVERYTGRFWATAQFIWTVPTVVAEVFGTNQIRFTMPKPYVSAIDEIGYLDADDVSQILSTSSIDFDQERQKVAIPNTLGGHDWSIKFTAGPDIGLSAAEIWPDAILQAMYLLIGDAYVNRQARVQQSNINENPAVIELMHDYRVNMGV